MKVPFLDLKSQNGLVSEDILSACKQVIASGRYIAGDALLRFESEYAEWCGAGYCIGVGNGYDALRLTLLAWRELGYLDTSDEVLVPANSFVASALAISDAGLRPRFLDVDLESYNITAEIIASAMSENVKAIMPVHLYGAPCAMTEILELANASELLVLEDCAQAHGATYKGSMVGTMGHAGAFSFYPGKILGALGDAGAILTDSQELSDMLLRIRNYGSSRKYQHDVHGVNSRLDEIQAAILTVKLAQLEDEIESRRTIAHQYERGISHQAVTKPKSKIGKHSWHLYVVQIEERQSLVEHLEANGIDTMIHYPVPIHKQPIYQGFPVAPMPVTEFCAERVLSLPIYSSMTDEQVNYVCEVVNGWSV